MKKKILSAALAFSVILTGCTGNNMAANKKVYAENLNAFAQSMENEYYVQQGQFIEIDCLKLASEGKLTSCFGNNQGSTYQVAFLPPAPEQDYANGIAAINWADEKSTQFDDPTVENFPANPYFAPVGWSYKLRTDEAVVLMYDLPPESKYFSIGAYLMLTGTPEGKDLSYDRYKINLKNPADVGNYNVVFASLGDQLNNFDIASSTTKRGVSGNAYGSKAVVIMGGDENTNNKVKSQLIEQGINPDVINLLPIPSQTVNMGLETGADTFCLLGRVSQPADESAYQAYLDNLYSTAEIYRITPKTEGEVKEIPSQPVKIRGTGKHEAANLGYATKDLEEIRTNAINKYAQEGYSYQELIPHISVPDGITSIFNSMNGKGDNRDTSYLSTDYFTFENEDDFVLVYGLNHTQTGKATYSNTVLYGVDKLNGVASIYDSMYLGSAAEYLTNPNHDINNYYVYKIDRFGIEPYSVKVDYSTGNEQGKYYGVDNGQNLLIAFRAYVEPTTGIGPSYDEIVYDRAIVFKKSVSE